MKSTFILFFILFLNFSLWSQEKIIDHNFNSWWSNINKYEVYKNWSLGSEIHIRRTNGLQNWQQFLFRPFLNYQLNEPTVLSVGYTYILTYPYGNNPIALATPEHNFWEQLSFNQTIHRFKINHRYRMEHRYVGALESDASEKYHVSGFNPLTRFRYRLTGSFPILKNNNKLSFDFFDEIWFNLLNNLMPIDLNQNWLYAGLGYKISSKTNIQLGYMQQLIKYGDAIHFENNSVIQFTIGHHFIKEKNTKASSN